MPVYSKCNLRAHRITHHFLLPLFPEFVDFASSWTSVQGKWSQSIPARAETILIRMQPTLRFSADSFPRFATTS